MSNLPTWVKDYKTHGVPSIVGIPNLIEALAITWEALEKIADENHDSPGGIVYDAKEAMRRIEELGKPDIESAHSIGLGD